MTESSIPKFFEKNIKEKLNIIADFANISENEIKILEDVTGGLDFENANKMIENAIGTFALPLGIATNFRINEKDYLVPMVIEEPSVVAAASKAAKIARKNGGFKTESEGNYSIGQIQVLDVDIQDAISKIISGTQEIIELANSKSDTLSKLGKGVKEISCKEIPTPSGSMLIVELMILVTIVCAFIFSLKEVKGQLFLFAARLFIGLFFVVLGQVYTSESPVFLLFLYWSILMIGWTLISNFSPQWFLLIFLVNIFLITWWNQWVSPSNDIEFMIYTFLMIFNGLILSLREYFASDEKMKWWMKTGHKKYMDLSEYTGRKPYPVEIIRVK